jgi:hypothetical protein
VRKVRCARPDGHPVLAEVLGLEPLLLELLHIVLVLHARAPAQMLEAVEAQVVLGEEAIRAGPQATTYVFGNICVGLNRLGRVFHAKRFTS